MTYDVTSTYAAPVDADLRDAYTRLLRLDPMRTVAARLSALGIDDRVVWAESPQALGLVEADGERELVFGLLWRLGGNGHARVVWRFRLDEDGFGRTVLWITTRARGSSAGARARVCSAWPLVETVAAARARSLRRALESCEEEERAGPEVRGLAALCA